MKRKKRKVAVVLSGGGAKGAYEAGALLSIIRKTQDIHVMTGASIGAINAAVFAWEYERTGDMLLAAETVKKLWMELDRLFNICGISVFFKMLFSFLRTGSPFRFKSLVSNEAIIAKIKRLIPMDVRISDIKKIELVINATCLTTGKTVAFTRDNDAYLYEAVLASSSIPIFFKTYLIDDNYYVDGGLFNNTPLRDAIMAKATDVFVVELKPKTKDLYLETIRDNQDYHNVAQVSSRLMELILDKIMYEDLKKARKTNQIIEIINSLEKAGEPREIIEHLKNSIGYEKNGKIKQYIEFYEIAPSRRLDPPGTLGFDNQLAIREIIRLGEADADAQLENVVLKWNRMDKSD